MLYCNRHDSRLSNTVDLLKTITGCIQNKVWLMLSYCLCSSWSLSWSLFALLVATVGKPQASCCVEGCFELACIPWLVFSVLHQLGWCFFERCSNEHRQLFGAKLSHTKIYLHTYRHSIWSLAKSSRALAEWRKRVW